MQPGKKNNLLLKDLLKNQEIDNSESDNNKNSTQSSSKKAKSTTVNKNQLKGKRKDLPEVTRNMLETEQQKMISLYRELKKAKGIQADKS